MRDQTAQPNSNKVVLGWVGSTGTVRGLSSIQKPLENLFARYQNLELRILGCADQSLLPRFQNVRFTVREDYNEEDMIRELLAMDVGLYPPPFAVEDYCLRGPLKALLYMTAGMPAVCQNAGDCSQLIEDGVTGMLANTPEEWESKLDMLIRQPALRRRIGAQALQVVRGEHSLEHTCRRLEEALCEVMNPGKDGRACRRGHVQGVACRSCRGRDTLQSLVPIETSGDLGLRENMPAGSQSGHGLPRPQVLLIADVPNWIFARHCKTLARYLADEFDIEIAFHGDSYNEDNYDLIYPLEGNLVKPEQIRTPAKYITGIRSHLHWPNLDFFPFVSFLSTHFQRVHVVSERLHRIFAPFLPTVDYVTHGIDTTFFTPSTQADQSGRKVRIGWAGNRTSSELSR